MDEIVAKYFILNDKLLEKAQISDDHISRDRVLYDVVRIIEGVPLFWQAHFNRLKYSSKMSGLPLYFSSDNIYRKILHLIKKNGIINGNIKMSFIPNGNGDPALFIAYFIAHHYPDKEDYNLGVRTMTLNATRTNPNVKLINHDLRNRCNQLIRENQVYEILLVDNDNNITEGSRSNVFFIKGDEIITPMVNDVLPGITRGHIIDICKSMKLQVSEKKVPATEINQLDGIFISGTSPKVLPVIRIDDFIFSFESIVLKRIMEAYDRLINNYIKSVLHAGD